MRRPSDFDTFHAELPATGEPDMLWQPHLVKLTANDVARFRALCASQGYHIIDRIDRQLMDLASVRYPAHGHDDTRVAFVSTQSDIPGGTDCLGAWALFPWDQRVVHVLDAEDYFDVITNRNQDKLRRDEQLALKSRCIGVIGLSVGGEAAVTLAQEHLCGELRLADFDALDLSNLNRLNAGCDDLGVNKAVLVARRIARINPFLEVRVYPDGVTPSNVAAFLDGLDLLVEECDALQLKYDLRLEAKARALNVIYAADERGFLSVEPYGQDPGLAPFHGLLPERPRLRSEYSSTREFMDALTLWLGGPAGISARSRASLTKIGASLLGYPQLASEARFSAGQLGHVARRILLGERVPPFVGTIDMDALLPSSV